MNGVRARALKVDPRKVDVFSFGCTAIRMVSNSNPFSSERREEFKLRNVPDKLNRAILRCIEDNPMSRPSMKELRLALVETMRESGITKWKLDVDESIYDFVVTKTKQNWRSLQNKMNIYEPVVGPKTG